MYQIDSYSPHTYKEDDNPVQRWLNRKKELEVIIPEPKPVNKEDSFTVIKSPDKKVAKIVNKIKGSFRWLGASRYCYENLEHDCDNFTEFNTKLIATVKEATYIDPAVICTILSSGNRIDIKSLLLKILK